MCSIQDLFKIESFYVT